MQNTHVNFLSPGFLGIHNITWYDMRHNTIRVRQGQRLALNKAARRATRNGIKQETARAIKDALL
jgi:hypothetical protein